MKIKSTLLPVFILLSVLFIFAPIADAAPSAEQYGVIPSTQAACPTNSGYSWVKTGSTQSLLTTTEQYTCKMGTSIYNYANLAVCVMSAYVKNGTSCACNTTAEAFYVSSPAPTGACGCPSGKEMNLWTKSCDTPCPAGQSRTDPAGTCAVPPPLCSAPKIEVNGACACPSGTFASGEACVSLPDCSGKLAECTSTCAAQSSTIVRHYCEDSTSSDPSTQLFSGATYACECAKTSGCPTGQTKVLSSAGLESCRASGDKICPTGSFYGEFQGVKGCIEPTPPESDSDLPPNNCISGTNPVYHGSSLYCVPPPNSDKTKAGNEGGCPAGTTPTLTNGTYLCKNPDGSGRTGSGGSGSGSNSGSGIGSSDAAIAAVGAVEQQLKDNAEADKTASDATNKELKDLNSKLFATNQQLQSIKDKIPTEIKSIEEAPLNAQATLASALDTAIARLENAPIIAAGADVLGSFPDTAGACPVISFSVFGREITGDMHCTLFEDVKPQFEAVMLAFWSIFAVFVFRRMS